MRWVRMLMLLATAQIAIFVEAAPVGLSVEALPSPDLLLCVVGFWALRRPEAAPVLLIFVVGLCRDLLTDAPLGAGTLSLVLGAELLKTYRSRVQRSFALELLAFAGVVTGGLVLQWLLVTITLGQPPHIGQLALMALATVASYPPLALVFRWLLGVRWRNDGRTRSRMGAVRS